MEFQTDVVVQGSDRLMAHLVFQPELEERKKRRTERAG